MPYKADIKLRTNSSIPFNPPKIKVEPMHGNGPTDTFLGNQPDPIPLRYESDDGWVQIKFTKVDPISGNIINIFDADRTGAESEDNYMLIDRGTHWELSIGTWPEHDVSTDSDSSTTNVEISTNQ